MEDYNAEGTVVSVKHQGSLEIDLPASARLSTWCIDSKFLKLSVQKGQQLLLFDEV